MSKKRSVHRSGRHRDVVKRRRAPRPRAIDVGRLELSVRFEAVPAPIRASVLPAAAGFMSAEEMIRAIFSDPELARYVAVMYGVRP